MTPPLSYFFRCSWCSLVARVPLFRLVVPPPAVPWDPSEEPRSAPKTELSTGLFLAAVTLCLPLPRESPDTACCAFVFATLWVDCFCVFLVSFFNVKVELFAPSTCSSSVEDVSSETTCKSLFLFVCIPVLIWSRDPMFTFCWRSAWTCIMLSNTSHSSSPSQSASDMIIILISLIFINLLTYSKTQN